MKPLAAFLVVWIACAAAVYAAAAPAQPGQADQVVIRNKGLEVKLDPATGRISLSAVAPGRTFAREVKLRREGGRPAVVRARDGVFGDGQAIEVTHADGERESVLLCDKVPFVLFRSTLRNGTGAPLTLNKVPTLSAILDAGAPADELRALGTGGLKALDKNGGSYVWLAIA